MNPNTQNPKIYHFEVIGMGTPILLACQIGKLRYQPESYSVEKFLKQKNENKLKFSQLPVIEIAGKQYTQSIAILNYIGAINNLYPTDLILKLQCDEAVQLIQELMHEIGIVHQLDYFGNKEDYQQAAEKFSSIKAPKNLERIEKLLSDNQTGYFVENKVTIADLFGYTVARILAEENLLNFKKQKIQNYPFIFKLYKTIGSIPEVEEYMKQHFPI